jgi:hypothetical protein
MKRTLLTTGLSVALLLATAFPASAVSNETLPDSAAETVEGITETPEDEGAESSPDAEISDNQEVEIHLLSAESDIDVQVPESAEFTLNPYRVITDTANGPIQDVVISQAQTIVSHTAAPLSVKVSATGVVHGEASLAASPDKMNRDAKSAFLWLEFHKVTDGEEPVWSGEYVGTRNQVLLNGESRPVLELDASEDGEAVKAAFRIFGTAGVPSEGMWTVEDSIDALLSFEFEVIEDGKATLFGVMLPEDVEDAEPSVDTEPVENGVLPDEVPPVDEVPSDIAQPVENAEPSVDTESVENGVLPDEVPPVDEVPSDDTQPVEDAEPSDDTQPVENAEPSDDTQPVENAEPSDDTQPVENAEPSGDTHPIKDAQPSDDTNLVEDAETSDVAEPVEDAQPSDVAEPVGDAQPSDDTQLVEDAVPSDVVEPIENAEPSNDAEPVEDAEPSDVAEPVEDTQPSDVAEPVEDAKSSDDTEPVEDAEPFDDTEPVGDAESFDVGEPIEDTAESP